MEKGHTSQDLCSIELLELTKSLRKAAKKDPAFYAAVMVVDPSGRLLLGQRKEDGKWTSPAGGSMPGETPRQTALRETFEEANLLLSPFDLKELQVTHLPNGKVCHVFIARLNHIPNLGTQNDPDREVKAWDWFGPEQELPKMDEGRQASFLAARRLLAQERQLETLAGLNKALASSEFAGVDLNTADYSMDMQASKDNPWVPRLKELLSDFKIGDIPREVLLDKHVLVASQVDDGVYDAYVKNGASESGEFGEVLFRVVKMPLESMVQALMAKEFISIPKLPELAPIVPEPSPVAKLVDALMSANIQGDVNITIQKSEEIYVSFDGDDIGNKVALAEEKDDEAALIEISEKIETGQKAFKVWVEKYGGQLIQAGGDEGLARMPKMAEAHIEEFRKLYKLMTKEFTVTVGVGSHLSEATKARLLGKLKGKNRVEVYTEETNPQLKHKLEEDAPKNEAQKLREAGFGKAYADLADALKNSGR